MAESTEWRISEALQPSPESVSFDLDPVLTSVVAVRAEIPQDAFTAPILGTERSGNGVVISKGGLVLTVGYLIAEAETVWLFTHDDRALPGHVAAYDQETGFGLVQALAKLDLPALALGNSAAAQAGDAVVIAAHGGRQRSLAAELIAKTEFAGYWEYLLDEAIFTTPAHPNWGGTGAIDENGDLIGVGSLYVQQSGQGGLTIDSNMVIPIDLLKPILDDLLTYGRRNEPARPWLGIYTAEVEDRLVVAGLVDGGPADMADMRVADVIAAVDGKPVMEMGQMLRSVWALGEAGVEVPVTVQRDGKEIFMRVPSADRMTFLKSPQMH